MLLLPIAASFVLPLASCGASELVLAKPEHPQVSGEVWNGEIDEQWYDASTKEFTLSTAQQLAGLASLVNRGVSMQGRAISLDADIYLNDIYHIDLKEDASSANRWTPIGVTHKGWDFSSAFKGVFDGTGHAVYGMYIDDEVAKASSSSWASCGLFGAVDLESDYSRIALKNFSVRESFIDVNNGNANTVNIGAAAGAIVNGGRYGRLNGILNVFCHCDFKVSKAMNWLGGVVGLCAANCINCGYTGDIIPAADVEFVGGVAGGGGKPAYVINSYSTMNMSSLWKKVYNCGGVTSSCIPLYSYYMKNSTTNISNRAYGSARRIEKDTNCYAEGNGFFANLTSNVTIGDTKQIEFQNSFVFGDNRAEAKKKPFEEATVLEALNAFSFEGIFDRTKDDDAILARWKAGTGDEEGYPVF